MKIISTLTTILLAASLAACAGGGPAPTSPDPKVTARIVAVCMSSGLFKMADGVVALAVPAASLPIALVNAGVDQVCTHPETFAADATTVEWLVKQIGKPPAQAAAPQP
jgi:hypothetical protein